MDTLYSLGKRAPKLTDEQRIRAAEKLGLKLDPVGTADKVMIIVGFVIYGLTAVLVTLAWINRRYKPIRAKNLLPTTFILVAALLWYIGLLPTTGLVSVTGVWSECRLWSIWFRLSFVYIYQFMLLFREYSLHRIFVLGKSCKGSSFYIPVVLMAVFQLTFNLTAQLLPPEKTIIYVPQLEVCSYAKPFHVVSLTVGVVIWVIRLVIIILIRNIRSSFNELREALLTFIIGTINLVFVLVFHIGVKNYPLYVRIRIISCVIDLLTGALPVWIFLTYPVYQCYAHHDEYLRDWLGKLNLDGMHDLYQLQGIHGSDTRAASSDKRTTKGGNPEFNYDNKSTTLLV